MTHTKHAPATGGSLLAKHYFLLRRLHSLSGIVPIGLFQAEAGKGGRP
jgi:hypothetical protein